MIKQTGTEPTSLSGLGLRVDLKQPKPSLQ